MDILFLHALPLDGSMWDAQRRFLPNPSYAPTLYGMGDSVGQWARAAVSLVKGDRMIVVGCSVGGSCALEVAAIAPERVAALVLIGTKAQHRPDPALHGAALSLLRNEGLEAAWRAFWAPLFSDATPHHVVDQAKGIALRQTARDVEAGVTAFHSRPSRDGLLAQCRQPLVFVTGEDDRAPGRDANMVQASQARNGALHIVPECGHYVPLERPEAVNAILRDVITAQT
ncbi:alpha/beta hydrolase [Phreatobacter aquaticus]|uniref:Alpha/beta hydrolase n=1 Tax=Phreatobacter aquaticus TaxID=2570229 RepID=A0A4D7QHB2_9HYPH|nr:alpha/beta hydrolase [Phreatobacter aquaticus]QCK84854.1 alpha/beta hydrolase [Phreatobacter aquaticus]